MPIEGSWYLTRAALEDYARLVGKTGVDLEVLRSALLQEIGRAHFVRRQDSGAELWRGGKPLRLRFIVSTLEGVGGGAPQLVRVEGDHVGRESHRSRRVSLWDGKALQVLEVTDEVMDPGPERRVAYRLVSGEWLDGVRGRARPDHVERQRVLRNVPDWVRALRGQKQRR